MKRAVGVGAFAFGTWNIVYRYIETVKGTDPFSKHTASQHNTRFISGMHQPFIPTEEQLEKCRKYFPEYHHLLPNSLEELIAKRSIRTTVYIKPISHYNGAKEQAKPSESGKTIVIGGGPALISSANDIGITYINDNRQLPVANGSAWHLEFDSPSEAPTTIKPVEFMQQQIYRALCVPETLASAEASGQFSWRSLDWVGWITSPTKWVEGIRLAYHFQESATQPTDVINKIQQSCADRTKANEKFYAKLNYDMGGKLLIPQNKGGGIIVATTEGILSLFLFF